MLSPYLYGLIGFAGNHLFRVNLFPHFYEMYCFGPDAV